MRRLHKVSASAVIALASSTAHAQVKLFVDGDDGLLRPTGNPPAQSWSNAFKHLNSALAYALPRANAMNPYEIWIKGDTAAPYMPHLRSHDSSAEEGAFNCPEAECSGAWADMSPSDGDGVIDRHAR